MPTQAVGYPKSAQLWAMHGINMVVLGRLENVTDPAERARLEQAAADALRRGKLVILPTETVYGVFAATSRPDAIERLAALTLQSSKRPSRCCHTWHAPSTETVFGALPVTSSRHRHLMRRLWPGPVRFDLELSPDQVSHSIGALGVEPGVIDYDGAIAVRVPHQRTTQRVLDLAGVPVVAIRLAGADWGPDRSVDAALEADRAALAGIAVVLDDGPAMFGAVSTLVRLDSGGGYRVEYEGAYDTRMIDKHARMRILFLCTGNTCRSPMAEAIARSLLEDSRGTPLDQAEIQVGVVSAGTSATSGAAASPQTAAALRAIGVEPLDHLSRPLTRQLIADSDAIYTMSGWHREEVSALDPSAASRTWLLDPAGQDVPDPVGLPQAVYTQTAARLLELVQQRLTELDVLGEHAPGEDSR